MPIDKRVIEKSLLKKGFVRGKETHHKYFYHMRDGRETGAYAYLSHGGSKEYGDSLLKMMRMLLKLEKTSQVRDLFLCPLSAKEYSVIVARQSLK